MRRRALLGLLAVGGTAGCLRLEAGDGTTTATTGPGAATEPVETMRTTDAATDPATETEPETTTEREEATYPFGVSEDGVDPYLYSMCRTAVAELAYRSEYVKVDADSGEQRWRRAYEAEDGAALGHWNRKDGGPVDAFHTLDGNTLWREAVGDEYAYGRHGGDPFQRIFWDEEFQPLLAGPDWSAPSRVNETRPAVWELTADSVGETVNAPGYMGGELRAVEGARLRVDENGVIRRLEAVYRSYNRNADRTGRYRFRFVLSDVGAVSLAEPSWLGTAREGWPRLTASLTDDRRYVRLSVESGAIARGSRISVFDRNDDSKKFLEHTDRRLTAGDVVYVYSRDEDSATTDGALAYGSRPARASPPELPSQYHLVAFRRDSKCSPGVDVAPPS